MIVLKTTEKLLEEAPLPAAVQFHATPGVAIAPLRVFLQHEAARFSLLLTKMQSTLGNLRAAINGDVLMSDLLEEMHRAVLTNSLPNAWMGFASESRKPLLS